MDLTSVRRPPGLPHDAAPRTIIINDYLARILSPPGGRRSRAGQRVRTFPAAAPVLKGFPQSHIFAFLAVAANSRLNRK